MSAFENYGPISTSVAKQRHGTLANQMHGNSVPALKPALANTQSQKQMPTAPTMPSSSLNQSIDVLPQLPRKKLDFNMTESRNALPLVGAGRNSLEDINYGSPTKNNYFSMTIPAKRNPKALVNTAKKPIIIAGYSSNQPYNDILDRERAATTMTDQKRRSISQNIVMSGKAYDTRASVAMRRERLKDISYEELYPTRGISPLIHKEKDRQLKWANQAKGKNTWLDQVLKSDVKDKRQPPNQYFKTDKGKQVDISKYKQDLMFGTKRFEVSKLPKSTYIDDIQKAGKKHQVGPLTYKNVDPKYDRVSQRNFQGQFPNGFIKSNVDQTVFVNACKAAAVEKPQVGKYTVKYGGIDAKSKQCDFKRDNNPQRGKEPKVDKKEPGPQTYKLDQKDERKILSTKQPSISYRFYPGNKESKLSRFIDDHVKVKKGIPAPDKYHTSIETLTKRVSSSPVKYAHKR